MSFDIYLLVPAQSWPTARQLDEALVEFGYPVRLGERSQSEWDGPLAPVAADPLIITVPNEELAKIFGKPVGAQIEMSNSIAMPVILDGMTLDPDFGMETIEDSEEFERQIEGIDAGLVASPGDHLLWFSHHVDQRNYNAAMYILASLILKFGGHGFERQGMSHGRESFAAELLGSLYENPVENPFD